MELDLLNKLAVICGSTQGIGLASAKAMARRGATCVLVARNGAKLESAIATLNSEHGQLHSFLVADFSNPKELKEVISDFISKGNKPHILINNSGGPKGGAIIEADVEEFYEAFTQHLVCNHVLTQALYPSMKDNGYGRIINIISTSVKQPLNGLGVSNTIRGAVANWSKTMANELGKFNITVNNVLPGATNTGRLQSIAESKASNSEQSVEDVFNAMAEQSPMLRIAEPEEVAEAVAFLASPKASYINGINVPVDGGRTKSL